MVQKERPGFLPRGNTIYVFSVDGDTVKTAADATPIPVGAATQQQ
ncbi:hypothetical protein [Mesorhizobium sp. INR15]|nr:hypothetical protein [Mesorhizobium sp. INR15]